MAESDWDAYWRNAKEASMHKIGGPQDEMLERFWSQFFRQAFSTRHTSGQMILDIACGYGAVTNITVAMAKNLIPDDLPRMYGIDTSIIALQEVRKRFPDLNCVAATAAAIPIPDDAFDIVTSQFGIEYAGAGAVNEAARIVKPGGQFAAIIHKRDGGIYRECADNLKALNGVQQSGMLDCFAGIFRTAKEVQQGSADQDSFRRADAKFSGAVAAVEDIFRRFGKQVADGMIFRVYNDIAHMYRRFNVYDPDEVFNWIDVMHNETDAYAGRMASMLKAALDEEQLNQIMSDLTSRGIKINTHGVLNMGEAAIPSAWVLIAEKM